MRPKFKNREIKACMVISPTISASSIVYMKRTEKLELILWTSRTNS
jgi:hypothetical protein